MMVRHESGAVGKAIEALTSDALGAPHGFFTRAGGVSPGLYASLQCGFGAKEDTAENVIENRARAVRHLGIRLTGLATAYQIHSATAIVAERLWPAAEAPQADAVVARDPDFAIGVLTADCAPVLFADPETRVIGAAHAGWKGAIGGVLEAAIEAMEGLGADRTRIQAVVGPTIGPESYEVGPEFVLRFMQEDVANAAYFGPPADDAALEAGKARFNLPAYAIARLEKAGVAAARWTGHCTYQDPSRFYSNRRAFHCGEGDYGRLLAAIAPPSA